MIRDIIEKVRITFSVLSLRQTKSYFQLFQQVIGGAFYTRKKSTYRSGRKVVNN